MVIDQPDSWNHHDNIHHHITSGEKVQHGLRDAVITKHHICYYRGHDPQVVGDGVVKSEYSQHYPSPGIDLNGGIGRQLGLRGGAGLVQEACGDPGALFHVYGVSILDTMLSTHLACYSMY